MRPIDLDINLFERLADRSGRDLISILIPTHRRGGRDVVQDPIHLKNQLSAADDRLEFLGWRTRDRSRRLAPARELLEDKEFWDHQSAGLAVYVDEDGQVTPVSIPVAVEPESHVAEVFHLRHLVPGMGVARVPILVLTKKAVRLLRGTKFEIEEVDADLPESFDDVNWFVDREKERQQHPDRTGTSRNRHGHEPSAREDEDRNRFLRAVANALPGALIEVPVVVLGDDDMVERFAQLVDFETVSPRHSGVSAPHDDPRVLDLAIPALEAIESAREVDGLKTALDRLGAGQATTSIEEALPGAVTGRIGHVVIERGAPPVWGRLDATEMAVEVHDEPVPGDVDLLDRLVVESHRTGAGVTTVAEQIEGDALIATYRY